jgi:hypothetical protein
MVWLSIEITVPVYFYLENLLKSVYTAVLNVGLYFAQTTLFWFSEINATCVC